jgi:hypothetical protein
VYVYAGRVWKGIGGRLEPEARARPERLAAPAGFRASRAGRTADRYGDRRRTQFALYVKASPFSSWPMYFVCA